MIQPVVHPAAEKNLGLIAQRLPQSLLLGGLPGVGLLTIATWLAGKNAAGYIQPHDAKGNPDNENGTISVEAIRRLYEQTRAKYTSRQIIIIDNAERMSHGAQSAFLKLLEEPNEHIYFILTSHHPQQLLPTIRSRVQQLIIAPLTPEQTTDFIESLNVGERVKQTQLTFIAPGLPAELTRLTQDEAYFAARATTVGDARDFLQGSAYEKLVIIQKYKASRADALRLLENAMYILRRTLSAQPQPALITQLDQLLTAKERIGANHNIALQLAKFVL